MSLSPSDKPINQKLVDALNAKAITVRGLADKLGFEKRLVQAWIEYRRFPQDEGLEALCTFFKMSPEDLGLLKENYRHYQTDYYNRSTKKPQASKHEIATSTPMSSDTPPTSAEGSSPSQVHEDTDLRAEKKEQQTASGEDTPSAGEIVDDSHGYQVSQPETGILLPALNETLRPLGTSQLISLSTLRKRSAKRPLRPEPMLVLTVLICLGVFCFAFSLILPWLLQLSVDQMIQENPPLLLSCGDCEQPNIAVILTTITIKAWTKEVSFQFQITDGTNYDFGLQFPSITLSDLQGNYYKGQAGLLLVKPSQPTIEEVLFPSVQLHGLYMLRMVVSWHDHFNYYQPATITL